ncbi:hypothetical protein [Radiobacillus sp. PE A8.2]|uniref:hypothetical protein n=1 Tax=Radiobacillus sp. PE A8.2 TaxID=3380349 RepID=UPI003890FD2C
MIWIILAIIFAVSVIYSLEVIQYQLRKIISKNQENELLSNEEIEKELEEYNR